MFILVVFLLLLKCAKRKAKFYFIPIQKKKEKTSRSCQLPRDFFFCSISMSVFLFKYILCYYNTSYVIINQELKKKKGMWLNNSNTSYVIINLGNKLINTDLEKFKYILCYY